MNTPLVGEERAGGGTKVRQPAARVEWLIDNADAYAAIVRAIRGARHSVWITQLAFDLDCVAYGVDGEDLLVADVLLAAARQHELDVRLLLNESLLVNTAEAWRERVRAEQLESHVHVRGISRFPGLLHAKMLIVDGQAAFLLGSPFVNGYWDDATHAPTDGRRPMRELGGRPLHDLSVRVEGSAVSQLAQHFREWWSEVATGSGTDGRTASSSVPIDRESGLHIAITEPARVVHLRPNGATEILSELEHGIALAGDLLYIEHQYLSSRRIVAAIVAALTRSPELCVVVLLNQNPDVTAYRGWQNERLEDFGLLHHPRVGLFTPWTAAPAADGRWSLSQVFVHSKVIVVDDAWAVVGSANLDGVSLHSYGADFASRIGARVFRDVRNFDVALRLHAQNEEMRASIRDLRQRLREEHTGSADEAATGQSELDHWRTTAAHNLVVLGTAPASNSSAGLMILPYDLAPSPRAQLDSLGLGDDTIALRFEPGWLEVHCSPNWIRNMFA